MTRLDEINGLEEADAEDAAGQPITVLEDDDAPKVRIFMALAWAHKRRTEPELTFAEYQKTHRFRDAMNYLFGSDEEDAEAAAGDAADPFPEGGQAPAGADAATPADAESPVLSGDGSVPV